MLGESSPLSLEIHEAHTSYTHSHERGLGSSSSSSAQDYYHSNVDSFEGQANYLNPASPAIKSIPRGKRSAMEEEIQYTSSSQEENTRGRGGAPYDTGTIVLDSTDLATIAAGIPDLDELPTMPDVPDSPRVHDLRPPQVRGTLRRPIQPIVVDEGDRSRGLEVYDIGQRFGGPDLDSSDADIVRVLNVVTHTVLFIFTEHDPRIANPWGSRSRYITAARISIDLVASDTTDLVYDTLELANERGTIQRIKIWCNPQWDYQRNMVYAIRHYMPSAPEPVVEYYEYDPEYGAQHGGIPIIYNFKAEQATRSTSYRFNEDFRSPRMVRFSPSTEDLTGDIETMLLTSRPGTRSGRGHGRQLSRFSRSGSMSLNGSRPL